MSEMNKPNQNPRDALQSLAEEALKTNPNNAIALKIREDLHTMTEAQLRKGLELLTRELTSAGNEVSTARERLEGLVTLANDAKSIGAYPISNAVFAYCLRAFHNEILGQTVLQSDDTLGVTPREAYYDLFGFRTPNGGYLCIPVPLIKPEMCVHIMKQMPHLEERGERARQNEPGSDRERREMTQRLTQLLPEGETLRTVSKASSEVLTPEASSEVLSYLCAYNERNQSNLYVIRPIPNVIRPIPNEVWDECSGPLLKGSDAVESYRRTVSAVSSPSDIEIVEVHADGRVETRHDLMETALPQFSRDSFSVDLDTPLDSRDQRQLGFTLYKGTDPHDYLGQPMTLDDMAAMEAASIRSAREMGLSTSHDPTGFSVSWRSDSALSSAYEERVRHYVDNPRE